MTDSRFSQEQLSEIAQQQEQQEPTKRPTVASLEEKLFEPLPVLDQGFVRLIDYMGDDSAIVQAARVSYGKGTKSLRNDEGLIRYLMRHHHTTPFEMCEIKLHLKMPIFVARQWIRHRTASVNEYSARYSMLDKEFYQPELKDLAAQSEINNQGRGASLEGEEAQAVQSLLAQSGERDFGAYYELMNENEKGEQQDPEKAGLARELARGVLPLSTYTQMYWKIDLHNLLHFLALRVDSHAQYEIRVYAQAILDLVERWVPATYRAFMDYRSGSFTLSASMQSVVRRLLAGEQVTQEESGLSKREWFELFEVLKENKG